MAIDPNGPKVLAKLPSQEQAVLLVNYLGTYGIKAVVAGSGSPGGFLAAHSTQKWLYESQTLHERKA